MSYPDLSNPDLLDRIPLDARVVLDVGCASGALGAEYKRRNPRARYLGVESDAAAGEVARGRLDAVFRADLNTNPLPFAAEVPPGSVDCIIYGDVLEHLVDPAAVLLAHAALLSENGVVLVCMPNMEHWSFAERLLRGTWDYDVQGLFDRTHIRWFTQQGTARLLRGAGLVPVDRTPRVFDTAASAGFVDALEPALRRLGINAAAYRDRAAALQHVWRARHRPTERLALVSTMLSPVGGVSHVRVVEPMQALAAEPTLATKVLTQSDSAPDGADEPGIFIFHRPLLAGKTGIARVRRLIARGWLVVCEFDDHPDYIPALQQVDVLNFRAVHAVQTSTAPLAEVLRRDNDEVRVFPNCLARLPEVVNHRTPDHLTMVFAGLNRENEWPPYLDALNSALRKAGERLHVMVINDRGLFDQLTTPHKSFVPLCSYETYQALLARSEISFMPLLDTPFNRCKSDLKFIEAAAHRVTALASPVVYADAIEDGRTGVIFQTPNDLEQRLLRLVANPEITRAIGDAARGYVAGSRMLAYQIAERVGWYHDLWQRREELTRRLLDRMPDLAG